MDYNLFLEYFTKGDLRNSLHILTQSMFKECADLMRSKTGIEDESELLGLFHDAFLYFDEKYKSGKFEFREYESFRSYFKTACLNKAKEFRRYIKGPQYIISYENLNQYEEEFEQSVEEQRNEEYQEINQLYGIDLYESEEPEIDMYKEAVRSFHTLNDKCKFLIVLKHFLKLSHNQIVEALRMFFEIKNENVSKTELQRCMDGLRRNALA